MDEWMTSHMWQLVLVLGYVLTWLAVPHVLFSGKRPVSTLAWVWGILLFPYLGVAAYFLLGAERIKTARYRKRGRFRQDGVEQGTGAAALLEEPGGAALFRTLAGIQQALPTTVSRADLLVDAPAFYPDLLAAIGRAERHVHVMFYIWRNDEYGRQFRDELVAAALRGVRVRLLLDQLGCFGVKRAFFRSLVEAGGEFAWFSTLDLVRNRFFFHLRNHRKLQIIDGRTAFVGGMNVGREYDGRSPEIGSWRDAQMSLTGAAVARLQEVFAQDWFFATRERLVHPTFYPEPEPGPALAAQIIASGPDTPHEPMIKSWLALLNAARQKIWLSAGYFTPDATMVAALQLAAWRGVDVRLLVSVQTEHPYLYWVGRSYYEELLEAGVRIYEFDDGMHHAKVMTMDDAWGMVGSANFDIRSMRLNFELNVLVASEELAAGIATMLEADFARSREIRLAEFRKRPWTERVREACFRPFSPLL